MRKWLVSVLGVLALALATAAPAAAQSVRIGGSVRISDDVVVGFSYGDPYLRYDGSPGYRYRHSKLHRKFRRHHRRYHRAIEREHQRLHYDLSRGYVRPRAHRAWHDAVGYEHHDLHHDLDDRHVRAHRGKGRHRGHR
jgi:hypothetical protein